MIHQLQQNDTGTVHEDGTLTVNDGDGANSSGGVTDDGQTADISNEETSVSGLSFNNDGTKMFVSGGQSDTVHEYSLSTAFDVSTKSATANESYSDASNYDWTRGHTWNADGTKLFIIDNDEGESWQKILEHTVQTAFDLSSTVTRTNTYDLVAPSGGSIPTRPKGITFNSDGTKMYIADHATDKIHQFTLSVGFDLTSTVVNSGTLDVSSQNDSPYGVEFSQDGSKVFVVGNGTQGDAVYQYTLNTAWDITSTATYNDSFNLSSQDSVPADIRFNNDGTKMFIAGSNGNEIDEYTLSTPFEIASISGDHDGDVLVDDTDPDGDTLTVTTYSHTSATDEDGGSISSTSSTGTAGTNNVTGYYGTLDLEGDGSYTYTADLTATQALDPGDTVTDVFTYTVDDGNGETDTATITITVIGVNDTPVAQNDVGVIVEDGTLTVANSANANLSGSYDATGEHSGDVIDTSSSSHTDSDADASASLTVTAIRTGSSEGSGTAGSIGSALTGTYGQLTIAADGSYSYVANQDLADALDVGDSVTDTFNYTLSDGTATDIGVITITILGANDNPTAVNDTGYIKEGGTLTVANSAAASSGTSTGNHTGDMTDNDTDDDASSTATITSITAALGDAQTTFSSNSETVTGAYGTLTINSNGSYSYVADSNISGLDAEDANVTDVFTYIVSDGTATSAATLTINVIASQDLTAQNDTGTVNEDATLEVDDGDNANSITATATFVDSFSVSSQDTAPQDLAFNTDGTKMFVVGSAGDAVNEYTLSTGFDVSTATFVHSFSVSSLDTAPQGLAFNTDGTKMFVLGNSGIDVNEYTLSTGFDVSTASFVDSFSVSSQETNPLGLAFNTDGTKMFVSGTSGADVNEYTLSIGFDVSSATFVHSFSVSSQDIAPYGLAFNTDGTKMFVVGTIGDDVNEYTLSTGFDVSTASFVDSFSVSSQEAVPVGLAFNTDGTKMFVVGHEGDDVTEYSLTTPFSLVNVSGEHSGDVINTSSTDNYDTDPDGDTLTVTTYSHTSATDEDGGSISSTSSTGTAGTNNVTGYYGTLDLEGDGSYTYTADLTATQALDPGDTVTDVFTYTVDDGNGETDTATITITVNGMNDAPTAVADTDSVDAGSTVTDEDGAGTLVSDDTDPDASSSLYVTKITGNGNTSNVTYNSTKISNAATIVGSKGTLTFGSDGSYSYVADSDATSGDDVFTYTLTDGTSTSTATLTISVTEVANNAPTAANNTVTTNEDTDHTFSASEFGFTDVDGDSLDHVTIETLPSNGTLLLSGVEVSAGDEIAAADISNLVFRPAADANGASYDSFTFSVNDGTVDSASTYTMTIDVDAVNDAPTAANNTVTTNEDTDHTFSASEFGFTDVDGDSLDHVTIETLPSNGTLLLSGVEVSAGDEIAAADISNLVFRPAADANGASYDSFTFSVNDGTVDSASTYTMTIDVDAVNDAPTANDDTINVAAGTPATGNVVTSNDTDPDGDTLSVSAIVEGDVGSPIIGTYGTFTLNSNGSYTYTVDTSNADVIAWQSGDPPLTETFTYTASDGNGETNTATITVNVSGQNDAPTAANNTVTTNEDTDHTFSASEFGFTDVDGDSLDHVTIETLPSNGTLLLSGVEVSAGDEIAAADISNLVFRPAADANGASYDSFTFSVNDGTVDSASTYTMTIDVDAVNDAPTAANNTVTTNEDTDHTFSASEFGFTDVDGDSLDHVTIETLPSNGTLLLSGVEVSAGDEIAAADISNLVFRPAADANGASYDSFTFSVNDGTVDSASTYTMTIDVDAVNDAPTAANNTVTTNEDTDHTFSASEFGFTDVDGDSLDHVTIETLPSNGTLLLSGVEVSAGDEIAAADISNLVFRPAADANGASYDSFTFSVNDGTVDSASTYTMTIDVDAVNDAPTAANNTVTTNEDTDHTFSASEFGFTDVDGDSLDHVTIETLPSNGTLLLSGVEVSAGDEIAAADISNLVFRPAADANGASYDSFTFSVNDGTVDSASTYTMTIDVDAVNDAPTANDDTINVAAGTPATGNVVTSNDTDPDGDTLSVSAIVEGDVGSPIIGTYGTFTLNSNGSYTYTVDTLNADVIAWKPGDAVLTETFTYTASDGNGETNTATITVNVSGQNDAPTAANNTVTTDEDTDHTFDASEFGFTDVDGDSLDHVTIETLPSKGTLLLDGSAVSAGDEIAAADIANLVFRPAADGNGDDYDSFTFSVNDGTVDSGSYTMTVNVDAVNDAPTAADNAVTTNEDTDHTFSASEFGFTDVDVR